MLHDNVIKGRSLRCHRALITAIENGSDAASRAGEKPLLPRTGSAAIIGITGSLRGRRIVAPSVDKLRFTTRNGGEKMGIICRRSVEPLSQAGRYSATASGVATLRLDMCVYPLDGDTRQPRRACTRDGRRRGAMLDAAGFDKVIVETVGVGPG